MRTPQNSSNKDTSFHLAYIYRNIYNNLTLLIMTAMIWCCVFNLFWAESCRVYAFSGISLVTCFLFKAYKRFFIFLSHFLRFFDVLFILFRTFLHLRHHHLIVCCHRRCVGGCHQMCSIVGVRCASTAPQDPLLHPTDWSCSADWHHQMLHPLISNLTASPAST